MPKNNKSKKDKSQNNRTRMWQEKRTLIYVMPETKKNIKEFGKMGDTYNDAINNLIKFAHKNKKQYHEFIDSKND